MGTLDINMRVGVRLIIIFLIVTANAQAIVICPDLNKFVEEPKVGTLREISPRREPRVGKLLDLNLVGRFPTSSQRIIEIDSTVLMSSDPKYIGKEGRIRRLVDSLLPELKKEICTHAPVCRKGSDFLRGLIKRTYDVDTVMMRNSIHYYLEVPNFFPDGSPLVIDPTFRQFIDEDRRDQLPQVFVGTREELIEIFRQNGGELWADSHFTDVRNWTEEQAQAVEQARRQSFKTP